MAVQADQSLLQLNPEQRSIYNEVMDAVLLGNQTLIFIDGKAGRGKTFLINTLCARLRSLGRIVVPTATSAYAAQLYPGGRTTHSAFKVRVFDWVVAG